MTDLPPEERHEAATSLRRTIEAVERGEIEGDAFTRGYLLGVADSLDPDGQTRDAPIGPT